MSGPLTPFETPIVNLQTASLFRRAPYISVSGYRNAPTAVGTDALLPGQNAAAQTAALAEVISRASSWIDLHCFSRADGTLAASPSTETSLLVPKADGSLVVICNFKPILEIDAVEIGVNPSGLSPIDQEAANQIYIGEQTFTIPGSWLWVTPPTFGPAGRNYSGRLMVAWTYVNGYPHTTLAETSDADASELVLAPTMPGGSTVYGVYPGTPLQIRDGARTETVVVASLSGTTLMLEAPTVYAHTVPTAPDSIIVSATPQGIEQAAISLTSVLIKTRGSSAMVMPSTPGGTPNHVVMGEAGAGDDWDTAAGNLQPFVAVYQHS